jgi:hypothetical protein
MFQHTTMPWHTSFFIIRIYILSLVKYSRVQMFLLFSMKICFSIQLCHGRPATSSEAWLIGQLYLWCSLLHGPGRLSSVHYICHRCCHPWGQHLRLILSEWLWFEYQEQRHLIEYFGWILPRLPVHRATTAFSSSAINPLWWAPVHPFDLHCMLSRIWSPSF